VTGIVLAGGRSARLGTDKALLRVGDGTLLERAVSALRPLCRKIIVVSDPRSPVPDVEGCTMATDEEPGLGPLGGLATGLALSGDDWHLALACDLPLVRPELLELLVAESSGVEAVVPRAEGRLQPLLATYSHACLAPARAALASGKRALAAMLDQVKVKVLEEDRLREADPGLVSFTNVNAWEDYQAVLRMEEADAR
jgi:molybdopterin-guanine dinucleotide biosynthesis protein A